MSKTYAPTTRSYRDLLTACRAELTTLGYGPAAVQLGGAGELLMWLEQRGKGDLKCIERADLRNFFSYLEKRPSRRGGALSAYTVDNYRYAIKLLFDYCERHGLRGGSPLAGLPPPVIPPTERYVASPEEIAKLYAAAVDDLRLTAILHLLYGCGLRRLEVERLNVGDVDYAAGLLYVRVGKGHKRRVIPLAERVAQGLKEYQRRGRWRWLNERSQTEAFLIHNRGGRLRGITLAVRLKELVKKAEVNPRVTPHVLRHSIATHLLAGGMKLERIRDFLGHDHLETTQVYTRVKTNKR